MGYNIGVGEKEQVVDVEENYTHYRAEDAEHPNAPDLGEGDISGLSNYRYPSYTGFHGWLRDTDLEKVFLDKKGNMKGGHPGYAKLTKAKYAAVKKALELYRKQHPEAIMPTPETTKTHLEWELDYKLGRLVWFEFWMKWALDNCKDPIIYNS